MNNKFNFFIPLNIEKGGESGELVKIKGVASTDSKDSDGETLIPAGFDFEPLLKSGFLNWNHQARTTSKAICGEPTAAQIINDGKDFYIEGVLYPNEEGKNVVELAETLEKHSPTRRLGFSIEGQALERDILNPKKVTKARITGVAITQSPKNPNTLMSIVKGEYDSEFVEEAIEIEDKTTNLEQFNLIVSSLFNTQIKLEHCHRKTKNEPIHRALGDVYEAFADLKDEIIEQLIGLTELQYETISLQSIKGYNDQMNNEVADELCVVGKVIEKFAQINQYPSIENLSQEIYGIGAKLKYKLSLKEGQEEVELDKAMMVNQDINPPSVEGAENKIKLVNVLKKSDIYNQIRSRYTNDFEKAEQIYSFINNVKEKYMVTDNITPEVLEKAFNLLDESILLKADEQKSLKDYDKKDEVLNDDDEESKNVEMNKAKDAPAPDGGDDDGDVDEDADEDDGFEKAINAEMFAKSLFEKGMDEDEVIKAMTSVGVNLQLAETACANCIAQANEEKQGGTVTVLKKSETNDLLEGIASQMEDRFSALGTILKKSLEENALIKGEMQTLKSEVEKYKSTPNERRSVTTQRAVERFEKSNDGVQVYDSQNVNDMRALGNRLFQEVQLIKSNGGDDRSLEKAVADLEIAKTTNFNAISPRLRAMNIEVR